VEQGLRSAGSRIAFFQIALPPLSIRQSPERLNAVE